MVEGVVNARLEAVVKLSVSGPSGRMREIEAVVDTGFTEFLTVTPALAAELELKLVTVNKLMLADGSSTEFDVLNVSVTWDGRQRDIEVHKSDSFPLIGMGLLHGHRLSVDVVEGGSVLVEPR